MQKHCCILLALVAALHLVSVVECQYDLEGREELLNWDPPAELKKKYPYFLSGVDKEGSPVWVIEFGRWDIRSIMEKGGPILEDFDRYTEQMVTKWHHSPTNFSTVTKFIHKYVLIADLQGYNTRQLFHYPSVQKYFEIVNQFVGSQREFQSLKKEYIINTNIYFNALWTLSRPILAPLMGLIELYDSSLQWRPAILNQMEADQLPSWLSGVEGNNWKPIKVFGR